MENIRQSKKQRWSRYQQRLAGTTQMWQLLSFHGRFDPEFLEKLPDASVSQPGEPSPEQKETRRAAVEARSKYRLARSVARLRDKFTAGEGWPLSRKQKDLLKLLDDGTLLDEANRLTEFSWNGRLKRLDGSFVAICGSTGGYFRTVMCDWTPPDISEFDVEQQQG